MPDPGDILTVLGSVFSATAISLAAYGFGRPLARLFESAHTDQLERGVRSLLIGFPAAGFLLTAFGVVGYLNTFAISLLTLVGLAFASVELACSIAQMRRRGGLASSLHRPQLAARSAWSVVAWAFAVTVLGATLITALAPPTDQGWLVGALDETKNTLLAETLWNGEPNGLRLLTLPQMWALWGLALDGPVAASLMYWQMTGLVALSAVTLARRWVVKKVAWLAGLLMLFSSALVMSAGRSIAVGAPIGMASALLLSAFIHAKVGGRHRRFFLAYALLTLLATLPGQNPVDAGFGAWQHPLLLIALGGLAVQPKHWHVAVACVMVLLGTAVLAPYSGWVLLVTLPPMAVAGAVGAAEFLRLSTWARQSLLSVLAILAVACLGETLSTASPRIAVALGWQSREDYLLAASGSYRAATVFNQIRRPEHRLCSTSAGCLYFASPTAVFPSSKNLPNNLQYTPADLVGEAYRQGFEYLLMAEPSALADPRSMACGASVAAAAAVELPSAEKFAGAVEVIPIVEYEFADEYQRTTRYRLWKLQGRRAAASPTLESATRGEEVSSRPRSLTR